jgi:pimeloyl-ACP methyl ester carboxylesterase
MTTAEAGTATQEQTRAHYPDEEGFVERDGVRVFWERYGVGEPTLLLMPTWSIIHSRFWKLQIPYLARHFRAVTFDGRGNGKSDRPRTAAAYAESEFAADALAVLDATGTERAVLVSLSLGADRSLRLAAEHGDRVIAAVFVGPALPFGELDAERAPVRSFDEPLDTNEGWAKYNRHYWLRDYRGFLEFFFAHCFTEPHSTKQIEDCVGWGLDTDPDTLALTQVAPGLATEAETLAVCARVHCPVLVLHGSGDAIRPLAHGEALAEATRGELVVLEGSGHIPLARDPVKVNLIVRDFVESLAEGKPK